MQLVTWNCNQAFRRKQHHLFDLEPDIAVVPECEHPAEKGDWSAWTDWRWTGDDPHKGLGVFTRGDITVSNTTAIDEADHFLHVETGSERVHFSVSVSHVAGNELGLKRPCVGYHLPARVTTRALNWKGADSAFPCSPP